MTFLYNISKSKISIHRKFLRLLEQKRFSSSKMTNFTMLGSKENYMELSQKIHPFQEKNYETLRKFIREHT